VLTKNSWLHFFKIWPPVKLVLVNTLLAGGVANFHHALADCTLEATGIAALDPESEEAAVIR
jgi:hypothetical protein